MLYTLYERIVTPYHILYYYYYYHYHYHYYYYYPCYYYYYYYSVLWTNFYRDTFVL